MVNTDPEYVNNIHLPDNHLVLVFQHTILVKKKRYGERKNTCKEQLFFFAILFTCIKPKWLPDSKRCHQILYQINRSRIQTVIHRRSGHNRFWHLEVRNAFCEFWKRPLVYLIPNMSGLRISQFSHVYFLFWVSISCSKPFFVWNRNCQSDLLQSIRLYKMSKRTFASTCSSVDILHNWRTRGWWLDPLLDQYSFRVFMIVYCDRIHFSLTAVHCFDDGYVR